MFKSKIKLALVCAWATLVVSTFGELTYVNSSAHSNPSAASVGVADYGNNIPIAPREWPIGPPLTQTSSECVGYAWAAWLNAGSHPTLHPTGSTIYGWAKAIDGLPQAGTDISFAGAELLRRGYVSSISYTTDTRWAEAWISNIGPIVVASDWAVSMSDPGDMPEAEIEPSGPIVSRHAYLCYGERDGMLECQNSWGPAWGNNGSFTIRAASLARLEVKFALAVK